MPFTEKPWWTFSHSFPALLHPHVCTVLLIEASCPKLGGLIEYMIPDDSCAMYYSLLLWPIHNMFCWCYLSKATKCANLGIGDGYWRHRYQVMYKYQFWGDAMSNSTDTDDDGGRDHVKRWAQGDTSVKDGQGYQWCHGIVSCLLIQDSIFERKEAWYKLDSTFQV
jgi:hypothetical protein